MELNKKYLKLPNFNGMISEPPILSMDEYFKFVMFNIKNIKIDKKNDSEWRKKLAVKVPFKL